MTPYIEIGRRAYPLRFTLESVLRAQERAGTPFRAFFQGGAKGVCMLLYCALLPELPTLTVQGAADMLQSALRSMPAGQLIDTLLRALKESGFTAEGAAQDEADALLRAACRAGFPDPGGLLRLTRAEIAQKIDAFEAETAREMRLLDALAYMQGAYCLRALHAPARYPASPCMAISGRDTARNDQEMRALLTAWARRLSYGNA